MRFHIQWENDTTLRVDVDAGMQTRVFHFDAHTDGDSIVFFRRSDVISTGDIFDGDNYPFIDLKRGGTIQGIIAGLNHVMHMVKSTSLGTVGTTRLNDAARMILRIDG